MADLTDAQIQAEAIVKAACINAAATLFAAGKRTFPGYDGEQGKAVGYFAMEIWQSIAKPVAWTGK